MQLVSCHFVGLSQCNQTVISVLLAYRSANGQLSLCWLTTVQQVGCQFVGLPQCNQSVVSLLRYYNATGQLSICWLTTVQPVSSQFVGVLQCNWSAVSLLAYHSATGQPSACAAYVPAWVTAERTPSLLPVGPSCSPPTAQPTAGGSRIAGNPTQSHCNKAIMSAYCHYFFAVILLTGLNKGILSGYCHSKKSNYIRLLPFQQRNPVRLLPLWEKQLCQTTAIPTKQSC